MWRLYGAVQLCKSANRTLSAQRDENILFCLQNALLRSADARKNERNHEIFGATHDVVSPEFGDIAHCMHSEK